MDNVRFLKGSVLKILIPVHFIKITHVMMELVPIIRVIVCCLMDASIVRESNVLMDNVFNPNPNVLLHHKLNKFKILFQIKYKMV
jgi:hypothetical protein